MSEVLVGSKVWLRCTVSPGPFSNERAVICDLGDRRWLGFVNVNALRNKIEQGEDQVLANILDMTDETFEASIPGEAIQGALLEGNTEQYREHIVP